MDDELQFAEEAMLVLHAQEGDGDAFRLLVDRYDRRLMYFIRRLLDDAEEAFDVLQNVWLVVHRKLKSLHSPRAFRVWLYRIAHDQAISALRKRRPLSLENASPDEVSDDPPHEDAVDAAELVHAALGSLSFDHRRALTLRFLENMSVEDIADVLQCSVGTVKSRLHYARIALRRRIEESDHG